MQSLDRSPSRRSFMSKPVEVGSLKIGQYVLIDGEPCRIVEFEKSKPGQHGSAKARIVAISAFTGQKKNLISPVDGKAEVPLIDKRTGQVLSISGNLLQVMDMENYQTFETPLPDDEDLKKQMASGIEVEYWSVMGRNMVVRRKG
jgi:translation initiation factor 5A